MTEAERARVSLAVGRSRPELRGLHPKRGTGSMDRGRPRPHSRRPKHASRSREPDASSRTARRGLDRRGSMRARPSLSRPGRRPEPRRVGDTTRSTPSALRRRAVPVGGWGCLRLRHESPIDGHHPGAPQGLAMTNLDRKAPVRRVRHPEQRHRIARCACAAAATSQAIRSSSFSPSATTTQSRAHEKPSPQASGSAATSASTHADGRAAEVMAGRHVRDRRP